MNAKDRWPIGVFASVDAGLGVRWEVIESLGVPTVQLHAPELGHRDAVAAERLSDHLANIGVTCTAVFGGFAGESYADIPTVVQTVGLVPPATRQSRLDEMFEIADFAKHLGCDTVALHLGFIPESSNDRDQRDVDAIVEVTRQLCDHCDNSGQRLHLETGQESAEGLLDFIDRVDRANLKINFDPANMILYGSGEPIEALRSLADHVASVHCKDATWSDHPGETWGQEVPLGRGDVGIERYLRTLHEIGYDGALTIEREIPEEPERQRAELAEAIGLLTELKAKILG